MKQFSLSAYVLAAAFMLLLPACKSTTTLNPEAPVSHASAAPVFERKLSTINVPVSFQINTLQDKLNQELQGLLYQDNNLNDDNIAIKIWKKNAVTIRAENNKIYFNIPLHIWVKGQYSWQACNICPTLQRSESTEFDITLKSESTLSLTENYQIKSVTNGGFAWGDTKPYIELGPMKIGLARFVEPTMRSQMGNLTKQLDAEIQKRINIREYIQQAWLEVQKPILMDQTLDAWLKITPTGIRVSPLQAQNGEVSMRLGVSSYLETFTNGKPIYKPNPVLPKLVTDSRIPDEVQIGLSGEVSYAYATKLLKEQLAGKTFKFEGSDEVTIKDAAISPSGSKLMLMLDVDGKTKAGFITKKIKGRIFLKAVPYYDAETGAIKVHGVEYDIETQDKLLATANWLVKNQFRENLEKQINFPVKGQLEATRKQVQQTLDQQGRLHEFVLMQGTITEVTPDNIYLTETGIKALVNARGNLTIRIDKL